MYCVLGPTASGKTAFSLALAAELGNAEIINADSRQLYRSLDIGTAKVRSEEMQGVPHHLLDVLDPAEEVTVGWYQAEAKRIIDEITQRGNVPIVVGGSMLYISSLIDGLSLAPVADSALRQRLLDEYDQDNGQTLYRRLQQLDPEAAATIHPNNKPHLVRAVEICELTDAPKTDAVPQGERRGGGDTGWRIFGIDWPREALHERITARTAQMFEQGWVDEVRSLVERGYTAADPAMKSHGYKEIMAYMAEGGDLAELQESIAAKARQYAKRQLTWWRPDDRIHWIPSGEIDLSPARPLGQLL